MNVKSYCWFVLKKWVYIYCQIRVNFFHQSLLRLSFLLFLLFSVSICFKLSMQKLLLLQRFFNETFGEKEAFAFVSWIKCCESLGNLGNLENNITNCFLSKIIGECQPQPQCQIRVNFFHQSLLRFSAWFLFLSFEIRNVSKPFRVTLDMLEKTCIYSILFGNITKALRPRSVVIYRQEFHECLHFSFKAIKRNSSHGNQYIRKCQVDD